MKQYSSILKDLILKFDMESADFIEGSNYYIDHGKYGLILEKYIIDSENLSTKYSKDLGNYTLVSIREPLSLNTREKSYYIDYLAKVIGEYVDVKESDSILIVGLGNENISADSLGSKVISRVIVTRGIVDSGVKVSSITPGVMGLTGIESADIIAGVVDKVKPNKIIVIDSLCASAVSRLGKSIQITDTGIVPGSGIGNHRKKIDSRKEKVIVIGVPLLTYVNTFIEEYIDIDDKVSKIKDLFASENISDKVLGRVVSIVEDRVDRDFTLDIVTKKDIESQVEILSCIISSAINKCIHGIKDIDYI